MEINFSHVGVILCVFAADTRIYLLTRGDYIVADIDKFSFNGGGKTVSALGVAKSYNMSGILKKPVGDHRTTGKRTFFIH